MLSSLLRASGLFPLKELISFVTDGVCCTLQEYDWYGTYWGKLSGEPVQSVPRRCSLLGLMTSDHYLLSRTHGSCSCWIGNKKCRAPNCFIEISTILAHAGTQRSICNFEIQNFLSIFVSADNLCPESQLNCERYLKLNNRVIPYQTIAKTSCRKTVKKAKNKICNRSKLQQ